MGGVVGPTGINIAGHKLPYGLVAAIAGVLGIVLYLRFRQTGVSVGAPIGSATAADTTSSALSGGISGGDVQAPLANLSQQLSNLEGQVTGLQNLPPAAPAPAAPGAPDHFAIAGASPWLQTQIDRLNASKGSDLVAQQKYLLQYAPGGLPSPN